MQECEHMTDETTQVKEGEETQEESSKAFEAGFNKALGDDDMPTDEVPANVPDEQIDETPAVEGNEQTGEDITPKEAAKLFAGKTEDEIQEIIDRVPGLETRFSDETRKLYGRFGEVQSRLQKIEQAAGDQQVREITVEDFGDLAEEYPELTEQFVKGLQKIFSKPQPARKPADEPSTPVPADNPPADIEARFEAERAKDRREYEEKLLTVMHSDWETIPEEPEFGEFLNTLPGEPVQFQQQDGTVVTVPAEAARYLSSDNAIVAGECFTKYKDWKKASKTSKPARNTNRLEAAVTPDGSGGAPASTVIDDEAAFYRGFKRVHGSG